MSHQTHSRSTCTFEFSVGLFVQRNLAPHYKPVFSQTSAKGAPIVNLLELQPYPQFCTDSALKVFQSHFSLKRLWFGLSIWELYSQHTPLHLPKIWAFLHMVIYTWEANTPTIGKTKISGITNHPCATRTSTFSSLNPKPTKASASHPIGSIC